MSELSPLHEKLLGFLAAGVSQSSAALACGCSDGLVSQLLTDSVFSAELSKRRVEKVEDAVRHDSNIERAETAALKMLESKMMFAKGPMESAKIFQILNTAKKRGEISKQSTEALGAQTVTFVLPKAAAVQIQLNARNQVIDVAGRSMSTLPSSALPALAARKKEESDTERAGNLLENLTTVMNGVVRVL